MMAVLALISVKQTALGQCDVVLLQQLILGDTIRASAGLITMPQQQPQSQMPFQAYTNCAIDSP